MTSPQRYLICLLAWAFVAGAAAQTTFDFEGPTPTNSPLISGDQANYIASTDQAISGTQSLKFDYSTPDAFQSWTYDMPFTLTDGTISVWFHDSVGPEALGTKFGGSIILENVNDPSDFIAVEIWNFPYPASGDPSPGVPNYYLTRSTNPSAAMLYSRYFGDRSIGFHQVVFNVTGAGSSVTVDGIQNANGAGVVSGPGGTGGLRLRFMAWSATDGGFGNWTTDTDPTPSIDIVSPYITIDDLVITATAPAANTRAEGFEIESGTATYDAPTEFMGPSGFDNPFMKNLVPQWNPITEAARVHSGAQAFAFTNEDPVFKSLAIDLSSATPGTITLNMYDTLGPDLGFDKIGGAVILEQTSNPANFIALEVWNAPYPASADPSPGVANYYLTKGVGGSQATSLYSRYFGDRTVGWNTVTIELGATSSKILVNGIENANLGGLVTGPGLNDGVTLRIMNDSPTCGGFTNYADPATTELQYLYLGKTEPYLLFDDITVPVGGPSAAGDWNLYE